MPLQEVPPGEGHVTCEAFEWFDVGVSKNVSFEMLIPCEGLAAVSTENHCVG